MKKRFGLKSIVLTAALSVFVTLGAVALAAWLLLGPSGLAVATGAAYINAFFVGEYDEDAVADTALNAMVESLGDRWSYYMDADSYAASRLRRANEYVGIGITATYEEDGMHIQTVMAGSPAEQAGLCPGEIIVAVDGQDLTGENALQGADLIRGEENTQVVLTVRGADGSVREVAVMRGRLQSDPVTAELTDEKIGYVALANFYSGSAEHVINAVDSLLEQGAVGLVFDMRDNPGGYLEELTELLDYLLPEGNIYQSGTESGPRKAVRSDADCVDMPMVVLVNENTYSAAELFAAQLRESLGTPIVGQPTFGKGYSQQTFWLPGDRALNISTKTYYTGAGESLIGVGIVPDEVVERTETGDAQLEAAIDILIR